MSCDVVYTLLFCLDIQTKKHKNKTHIVDIILRRDHGPGTEKLKHIFLQTWKGVTTPISQNNEVFQLFTCAVPGPRSLLRIQFFSFSVPGPRPLLRIQFFSSWPKISPQDSVFQTFLRQTLESWSM